MKYFGLTDIGKTRKINQDSMLINADLNLFMVADGMGGHVCGEIASETAVHAINKYIQMHLSDEESDSCTNITMHLKDAISKAHSDIYNYSQTLLGMATMGTTLSLLLFRGHNAYLAHLGDSRIYRLRSGYLEKLTKDHTEVQKLLDDGLVTEDEAQDHYLSHIVTRALGVPDRHNPDIHLLDVQAGDRFLLSSDGLFREVTRKSVEEIVSSELSINEMCKLLMSKALDKGARDNISIIVIETDTQNTKKIL